MSGNREELAKRLAAWARDELGLSTPKDNLPTACPNKEELKILCRGNMLSVWAFFLERVRSPENVADVRANILLQHNKKKLARAAAREQELKKLKAQRETVSSSLSAVRAKLECVEKEVHALKQGLVQNDKQMCEQKNRVEAMEKRALALAALDQKTLTDTLVVKEYLARLRQALDGPAQSDNGEHSSTTTYGTKAPASSGMSLQTGSLMRVREAWEGIRGEIAQALESGDLRQPDALALQRHARNLGCLDGGEVLRCIAAIAAQDLALLQESDMFADAYDYGEVRWRIKLGLEAQELRFVETQAVANEARATRLLCESLLQQQPQPPLAHEDLDSGARRLRDAEVELEGAKLALKTLGDYIRKMELAKEAHQRQLAPLHTKVAEIRRFDVEHRDKQKSVAWLAARVARERALLPGEQTKTKLVVRHTLEAFRYPLPEAVRSLRRCLEPVPTLPLTPIPFYPAWDASLLSALSVPAYSAPSSLLSRAADMKYSERAEVVKAQHWTQLSGMGEKEGEEALARLSKKRAATLKEVSKVLVAQRKIQEEVWIPALDGCEGNARGGLKQVPAVHQYIQHWWEQPGQFAAPFVRVKGKNVEEWLQVIRCQPAVSLSPM